ncbi:MAG: orotate phosphoribosyltransferase [Candidatus Micrarchaeota archaeon]
MDEVRSQFVKMLLKKGALRIAKSTEEMFVLKSGRKSPHFVNMGGLTDGESLNAIKTAYAGAAARMLKDGEIEPFEYVFGPAYKGISLGALTCEGLQDIYGINTHFMYDRKEEKDYGDKSSDKLIVGGKSFIQGGRILIIDDVITTGGTKLEVFDKLRKLGEHKIVGILVAIDREERMGDAGNVDEKSASQIIKEKYGIGVHSIGKISDVFPLVEKDISPEIRTAWLEYAEKYTGATKLI